MGKRKEVKTIDLRMVPVGDLIPTADNPRAIRKGDAALAELAESIKAKGVIEPLLARPHPTETGKLDLRAGARRLAAAKLAGLETVPVIVREMTDQDALEVTVIENLQREDLDPMEESLGIAILLERGWDVRAVAGQLGRSPEWVVRRAHLVNLSDDWRLRHSDLGDDISHWSAGHLDLIARMSKDDQDAFEKEHPYQFAAEMTIAELDKMIRNWLRQLKNAPWDLYKDEFTTVEAPSCFVCQRRSNAVPGLFDGLDASTDAVKGRCLDRHCWDEKLTAFVKRHRKETPADERPMLIRRHARESKAPAALASLAKSDTWVKEVKKGSPGAKAMMRVEGPDAGKVFYGKLAKRGGTRSASSPAGKDNPPKAKLAELTELLRRKRWQAALDAARKQAGQTKPEDLVLPEGVDRDLWILAAYVFEGSDTKVAEFAQKMATDGLSALAKHCLERTLYELAGAFRYYSPEDYKPCLAGPRAVAPVLGIDLDALFAQAEKNVPEPKELTELREKVAESKPAKPEKKSPKVKGKGGEVPVAAKSRGSRDEDGKAKAAGVKKRGRPKKGVCRVCGCTETSPCPEGCAWTDKTQTLCTACEAKSKVKSPKSKVTG